MLVHPGGGATTYAALTDKATVDLPGTNTPLATALAALVPKAGGTMTGPLVLSGDASAALNPVSLQQMQAAVIGVGKRARARVTTTATITIATALVTGQVLNGVTLAAGDLVLVKDQSAGAQNGVYVAGATPARAAEFDTWAEFPGSLVAVYEGTVNPDTLWFCTNNDGGTLGTTAIVFQQFSVAGALLAVNNLSDVANAATARSNISAAPSSGIALSALATQAANTVDANLTGSPASPQAVTLSALAAALQAFLTPAYASIDMAPNSGALVATGHGSAAFTAFGTTAATFQGTAAAFGGGTALIDQERRVKVTASAINTHSGVDVGTGGPPWIMPSLTVAGYPIKFEGRAIVDDSFTGTRSFIGIGSGGSLNLITGNPSAKQNILGVGADDTDSVYSFYCNGTGTMQKVATTVANNTLSADKTKVKIRVNPFPTNTAYLELWDNDVLIASQTFTSNLPTAGTSMAGCARRFHVSQITVFGVYGFFMNSFSTVGDNPIGSGAIAYTAIAYSNTPAIVYPQSQGNLSLPLTGNVAGAWTETPGPAGSSWLLEVAADSSPRTLNSLPASWNILYPGGAAPFPIVIPANDSIIFSGVRNALNTKYNVTLATK